MDIFKSDEELLLTFTENGYGKRTSLSEYRKVARGGKGVINSKVTEKTGPVVGIKVVRPGQELVLITGEGIVIRIEVEEIPVFQRNSQGVRLMKIGENDKLVALAAVERKADTD